MGRCPRNPRDQNKGLNKGPWSSDEDEILKNYIQKHDHGVWKSLPKRAGLNRCGKSCRLRWTNYLRPDIKRGNFSPEEEQTIIDLHASHGNKWSMIASHLPRRTDNEIKNFWNTHLRKKLIQSGINPNTHQALPDYSTSSLSGNLIVNPLENLAMIRLIQTILLQILNLNNPWPSFFGGSASPSFDETIIPLQAAIPNLDNGDQSRNHDQDILETSRTTQRIGDSTDSEEYWLPGLVDEIYSGNSCSLQLESCNNQALLSENNEGWDAAAAEPAMDDEDLASFWRKLLDQD